MDAFLEVARERETLLASVPIPEPQRLAD
jgi:hypothetical protein